MSKDTGPDGGFGDVIGKQWRLKKISQEHGILTELTPQGDGEIGEGDARERLELGSVVEIVGQHACLIAAAHPWFYIVDSSVEGGSEHVQDIWIPWKGW
jgi:D-serine deaminase-like pyridoxal phosphate-dependent protein